MKPESKIIRKGNVENWWNKYRHCTKCILWTDGGEDDIDHYMMCSKTQKRDYQINSCPLSRNEYKIINK